MLRISKRHWPGAEHYSWRVQMGPTLFFTKVIYVKQLNESSCFPHCMKSLQPIKDMLGFAVDNATPQGQKAHALIQFSAKEHSPGVLVPCKNHRAGTRSHQWVKQNNMKQARGRHVFTWMFEIFFLKQVRDITGELAISWIYTRRSAQDGLVWCMDCTEEIAFSGYHCTKKEKSPSRGRQMGGNCESHYWWGMGGRGSKDTSVMTALLTNIFLVILGFNLNRW